MWTDSNRKQKIMYRQLYQLLHCINQAIHLSSFYLFLSNYWFTYISETKLGRKKINQKVNSNLSTWYNSGIFLCIPFIFHIFCNGYSIEAMEKRQMFTLTTQLCSELRSDRFRRMKGEEKLKEGRKDRRGRRKELGMLPLSIFHFIFQYII